MHLSEIVVVTMTLARTAAEEEALLASLEKLKATGLPIVIAEGGSRRPFIRRLSQISGHVVTSRERGLVHQIKAGIQTALKKFPRKTGILYTEPDKYPFFDNGLVEFLQHARLSKRHGVVVAARDSRSMRTFPEGQRKTETFMNEVFSWIVGREGDYCYGPLLLSRRAAELALTSPAELGWGWRFWTLRKAAEARLKIDTIEKYLPCPKEQRREDSSEDRRYRLKQLKQNLASLED